MKKFFTVSGLVLIILCLAFALRFLNHPPVENDFSPVIVGNGNCPDKNQPEPLLRRDTTHPSSPGAFIGDDVTTIDSAETYEKLSRYGKLSGCLQGTQIDGGFRLDEAGRLIISAEIRSLFEYFLTAMHEEGKETSIGRIREYVQLTLPREAEEEALSILDDYLEYRSNLKRFNPENLQEASKAEAFEALKKAILEREEQRRRYLQPEVVEAFFSDEEAFDHFNLKRMEIAYDESLNADEKEALLSELNGRLPEGIRESRIYRAKEAGLKDQIAKLQKEEGSETEIYALRENFYGKEAAERLAALDRERKDWQNRFNAYCQSKEAIISASNLSAAAKQLEIKRLQKDFFSEAELSKLEICEKIEAGKKQ